MIRTFVHGGLADLWSTGTTRLIDRRMHARILIRLKALDAAVVPGDMHIPGFDFHPLKGFDPTRYTVHVNGPWCITFAFDAGDAVRVDFEQYH